jgi:hypothetical protein
MNDKFIPGGDAIPDSPQIVSPLASLSYAEQCEILEQFAICWNEELDQCEVTYTPSKFADSYASCVDFSPFQYLLWHPYVKWPRFLAKRWGYWAP